MIQLNFSKPIQEVLAFLNQYPEGWITDIKDFIVQWHTKDPFLVIKTSGTTGKSKEIRVQKEWMIYSASNTIQYFELKEGQSALLALSPHFIAGKMMLVRAMVAQLNLWICPPNDLSILNRDIAIDFCPLVPLQAEKYVNQLHKIRHLLLGGAPVSRPLEVKLQRLSINVYQSFAMTETLSHFAIRNISAKEQFYKVFETINFGVDSSNCLWIKAPELGQHFIQTTDVVEVVEDGFIWMQRADFIINSGGMKFNPEVLEKECEFLTRRGWEFIISSIPDVKLGRKLVLVVESSSIKEFKELRKDAFTLEPYAIPKQIYIVKALPKTEFSQKITRLKHELIFNSENIILIEEIL